MSGSPAPTSTSDPYVSQDILTDKPKVPKGRNVSGRSWKLRAQKRATSLITKTIQNGRSTTWEKKMKEKERKRALQERERQMKEEKRQQILAKKERRLENEKRRMENEFKVASNSAQTLGKNADIKLKAMNKKQLRQIKKTRMNTKTGAIEFVSAYKR
jgi:rRNA-processing protein CGR1